MQCCQHAAYSTSCCLSQGTSIEQESIEAFSHLLAEYDSQLQIFCRMAKISGKTALSPSGRREQASVCADGRRAQPKRMKTRQTASHPRSPLTAND